MEKHPMHCQTISIAAVCPVDCCVPDPDRTETEDQLIAKAKKLHADKTFADLSSANSHFRK
jgi:hypothetical protein